MKTLWVRFWEETEGQDLVEYALIVAAIALGLIATVQGIGTALSTLYSNILVSLSAITTP